MYLGRFILQILVLNFADVNDGSQINKTIVFSFFIVLFESCDHSQQDPSIIKDTMAIQTKE